MYQALYRKWRPKDFEDVVGQEHITRTLQRQVAEGKLSHAYLFTGTRGTGKTTCAKILAKAVNCEHPVDGRPCNQCPSCIGIDNGSLLDVLEMDAASNNGVDYIRALREEAIYPPAHVKYRVYIVDEVHMLSVSAFNALLKILEEPPAHLIFILATTELHKVPATILSRCQRFAFKRILPRDIAQRLLYVAREEGIGLTPGGADLLARLADGALRDALSLLDQCGTAGGTIDEGRVLEVLGLAGNLQVSEMMEDILRRDQQAAILLLHQLYSGGKDIGALLGELSTLARDLLIRMTAPTGGDALLSGGYPSDLLDRLAGLASPQRLIHMTTLLQSTAAGLALSCSRRTDAELCLLRLCDDSLSGDLTALAARITRLEEGGLVQPRQAAPATAPMAQPAPKQASPAPQSSSAPAPQAAADHREAPPPPDDIPWDALLQEGPPPTEGSMEESAAPAAAPESSPAPNAPSAPAGGGETAVWPRLLNSYKSRLPAMRRAFLDSAYGVLEGDLLKVICASDLTKNQLHTEEVQAVLQEITSAAEGRPISVAFTVGQLPEASAAAAAPQEDKLDALIGLGSQFDNFKVK